MRQILWFRRDLRIKDNILLEKAKEEVLPLFIFDKNILQNLRKDDKRVTFIYQSVLKFKKELQEIGLDLALFYATPQEVFSLLTRQGFDSVLCSGDYDSYAVQRDKEISNIINLKRYGDSFILNPLLHVKNDGNPYKVFTPFYKALTPLTSSNYMKEYERNKALKKIAFSYEKFPTLQEMGFEPQLLPEFLNQTPFDVWKSFTCKIQEYEVKRDFFGIDGTSNMSVFLRFGLISPREVFNFAKKELNNEVYIKELFWREFYAYLLYHFPHSERENFNKIQVSWRENEKDLQAWKEGKTGIDIIDAAMQCLNETGLMPNRLRMITASFLTKNLLIDWKEGEAYFAKKLLDYEASSNIGSWQWAASTGADSVPYFRIFNPLVQSKKFDKEGLFIKKHLKIKTKEPIVSLQDSRKRAIKMFQEARTNR